MLDNPTDWRDLQEKVATLYRRLPHVRTVEVEAVVTGASTSHEVDVYVVFEYGGLPYQIVNECKNWKTRVKKQQVLTLAGLMNEIGAEKGVLVSRVGFQKGADRIAAKRNIDLLTFRELESIINDGLPLILEKVCPACGEETWDTTATCPECGTSLWRYGNS